VARVPTIAEEDAKRPNRERECLVGERTRIVNRIKATLARLGIRNFKPTLRKAAERLATVHTPEGMPVPPNTSAELQRDMARLGFVVSQIRDIEAARQKRLEQQPETGPHAMVRLLARIVGVGVETADMLVHEVLARPIRDRKAVARYAGLTGSPDESGAKRREQGLARAGNARVRRGMIQLAWRFLMFQKESALALWYRARTAVSRIGTRKTISNRSAMANSSSTINTVATSLTRTERYRCRRKAARCPWPPPAQQHAAPLPAPSRSGRPRRPRTARPRQCRHS
jgi:transposase